ncbi:MAG: hypothetical protein J1G30_04225 [Spirochaetales bacterium]|nr:hypothetical protein [Spirochaetales bacterium]
MKLIHIFKAGKHTDMNGNAKEYSREDIENIARQYNEQPDESRHYAPIVIGHPKTNAPAFGWIKKLIVKGDDLYAEPEKVDKTFADLVKKGAYRTRSAAFYADGKLRHVGFLGACPPAVKGLEDFAFSEDSDYAIYELQRESNNKNRDIASILRRLKTLLSKTNDASLEEIEYAIPDYQIDSIGGEMEIEKIMKENETLRTEAAAYAERIKGLEEKLKAMEEKEKKSFLGKVKEMLVGKMPQSDQDKIAAVAEQLYAEGGLDGVKDFLEVFEKMPVSIPQEKDVLADGVGREFSDSDEYAEYAEVDEERKKLDMKAKKIMKEKKISYEDALDLAIKEAK